MLTRVQMLNLSLINAIVVKIGECALRVHLRAQMETSGLRRILDKLAVFDHPNLRQAVANFRREAALDDAEIAEALHDDVMNNFSDPRVALDALLISTSGQAADYLASTMKHLLLVPTDGEARLRYFQLIDTLVASVVTDRKGLDGDFSSMFGSSVAAIASRFGDQERLEKALEDIADAKSTIVRLRRERETLRTEIGEKDQGLVGKLQQKVKDLERALTSSRGATLTVKAELATAEKLSQEKIGVLEIQVRELFDILQKTGGHEFVQDEHSVLDRQVLLDTLSQKYHRTMAIRSLEGTPQIKVAKAGASGSRASNETSSASPRKSRFSDADTVASPTSRSDLVSRLLHSNAC